MRSRSIIPTKAAILALCASFFGVHPAQAGSCPAKISMPAAPKTHTACELTPAAPGVMAAPKGWYCNIDPKKLKRFVEGTAQMKKMPIFYSGGQGMMTLFTLQSDADAFQKSPKPRMANPAQGQTVTLAFKNCIEASFMDKLIHNFELARAAATKLMPTPVTVAPIGPIGPFPGGPQLNKPAKNGKDGK